jgi:hypothetical protein
MQPELLDRTATCEFFGGIHPATLYRHVRSGHVPGERVNRNERPPKRSRFVGVELANQKKGWTARLWVNGDRLGLGTFETEEEAALAWNAAVIKHGLDRPLNNVPMTALAHWSPAPVSPVPIGVGTPNKFICEAVEETK